MTEVAVVKGWRSARKGPFVSTALPLHDIASKDVTACRELFLDLNGVISREKLFCRFRAPWQKNPPLGGEGIHHTQL
jgi:hypothetical protein